MKKPDITQGEWAVKERGFVVDENGSLIAELYCNENVEIINLLKNAKAISAVPEMIDALIETRAQLTIAMSHEKPIPTKVLVDWCTQVEQALKKAGCADE